jgi:hypothetical protein
MRTAAVAAVAVAAVVVDVVYTVLILSAATVLRVNALHSLDAMHLHQTDMRKAERTMQDVVMIFHALVLQHVTNTFAIEPVQQVPC